MPEQPLGRYKTGRRFGISCVLSVNDTLPASNWIWIKSRLFALLRFLRMARLLPAFTSA